MFTHNNFIVSKHFQAPIHHKCRHPECNLLLFCVCTRARLRKTDNEIKVCFNAYSSNGFFKWICITTAWQSLNGNQLMSFYFEKCYCSSLFSFGICTQLSSAVNSFVVHMQFSLRTETKLFYAKYVFTQCIYCANDPSQYVFANSCDVIITRKIVGYFFVYVSLLCCNFSKTGNE